MSTATNSKIQSEANTVTATSSALPERLAHYFGDYSSHHLTRGNKICHFIGIPLIVVTTLGLFATLVIAGGLTGSPVFRLDAGVIVLMLSLAFYMTLDWKLAMPFGLFLIGLYYLGRAIPVPALWTFFVLGWIVQYIGHYWFEKKSPSFYGNARHLLIGPFWIFAKMIGYTR
ncbi:MAG: DUF962 domain-containing protein [Methylotenera sp.]|nr:DUF962 domain-containing protein [Oligoflexia bacterium]